MRLRQRGDHTRDRELGGEPPSPDPPDFEWPGRTPDGPPAEPVAPPPRRPRLPRLRRLRPRRSRLRVSRAPTHRRRRRVAAMLLAALAAGMGGGLAVLIGGSSGLSKRERAQLEAAAPGTSARGHAPGVSPVVQRAAGAMPLPRQVAQLFVMGTTARGPGDAFLSRLRARGWGAVVLSPLTPGEARRLTPRFAAVARKARLVAPLVAAWQPGGGRSTFPDLPPRAQPMVGDGRRPVAVAGQQAAAAARALKRLRISMTVAPVADVGSPAGPEQDLVFGDRPRPVARMTAAAVGAYRRGGVVAAVSHFPGQGSAAADPDVATASVGLSLDDLRARDLLPFRAVARTAPVVMVSNAVYAAYDGVTPAVLLPDVVGRLLRRDLGFKGVVMTDDLVSTAPVLGHSVPRSAVEALEAGADMLYVSGGAKQQERAYRAVLTAVRQGKVSRRRLRISVERVLALKRGYGLLPAPRPARRPGLQRQPARRAPAKR